MKEFEPYMNQPMKPIKIHKVTLEKLPHYFDVLVSKLMLEKIDAREVEIDVIKPALEGAIIRLRRNVWAEKTMDDTHTFQTYKTWWDHTKARFAPKWFIKRWPVKFTTTNVRFKSFAKFPELLLCDKYKDKTIRWFDTKEVWED